MAKKKKLNENEKGQLSLIQELGENDYTEEQSEFIGYNGKRSVILSSCAGSGKTFSCVQRLKELLARGVEPSKIVFFSYTKAATEELQARIGRDDVKITTIHAFALGILAKAGKFKKIITFYDFIKWYKDKYKPGKTASHETKNQFYELIGNLYEESEYISSLISAYKLQSADGIKGKVPLFFSQYVDFLRETRSRDFADMLIEVRDMLKEDRWLKMFRNKYDYIFIDEYQDTSVIQLQILLSLNAKYYYLIGDKNQCLLPNTKIYTQDGIKEIKDVKEGDFVLAGKGGGNLINAKVAKTIINDNKEYNIVRIKTESGREIACTYNHIVFANYQKKLENRYFVYLMFKESVGFRIGITQLYNSKKSVNQASLNFKSRLTQENADKIWLLYTSKNIIDTRVKEQEFSLNYGIPTIVFKNRNKRASIIEEEYINRVFNKIDTFSRGFLLLEDLGYNFNYPHHQPDSNRDERKNINLYLCIDGRSKSGMSAIEVHTNNIEHVKKLESNVGLSFYKNKNKNSWRFRKASSRFSDIQNIAENIKKEVGYEIKQKAALTKGNYFHMYPASQIMEGMMVYVNDEAKVGVDIVKSVSKEKFIGNTYDLNIDGVHNFCANDIFVHNSIFGYSGANCDRIEEMLKRRRDVENKTLTVNFRSDTAIIDNSNKFSALKAIPNSKDAGFVQRFLIYNIENPPEEEGLDLIAVLNKYNEVVVLARTNAVIKKIELELLKRKYPLKYFNYITAKDIKDYKDSVTKGTEIHINLKERLNKIKPFFNNSEVDVIAFIERNKGSQKFITSIHKSKGREFDYCVVVNSIDPEIVRNVGLDMVLTPKQMSRITFKLNDEDVESKNIHYVAVSRARHGLFYMLYGF